MEAGGCYFFSFLWDGNEADLEREIRAGVSETVAGLEAACKPWNSRSRARAELASRTRRVSHANPSDAMCTLLCISVKITTPRGSISA